MQRNCVIPVAYKLALLRLGGLGKKIAKPCLQGIKGG